MQNAVTLQHSFAHTVSLYEIQYVLTLTNIIDLLAADQLLDLTCTPGLPQPKFQILTS